jgi:hypothetical protein
MYAGPPSGITPTFVPEPPLGQFTGPVDGGPVMPSPTTGRISCWSSATLNGQPSTNESPTVCASPSGSPVGLIA